MAKAELSQLDNLHNKVAKGLADNLDDPKTMALAIKFLKDNNITVDLQESKEANNLFTRIEELKVKPEDKDVDKTTLILQDYMEG